MTVKELMARLSTLPEDALVAIFDSEMGGYDTAEITAMYREACHPAGSWVRNYWVDCFGPSCGRCRKGDETDRANLVVIS